MADYKELIRKAIQALPENNGAARRAVYEKARAALVGQLRGLNPPLAARDITQHRLQLEDCIRQVEQEASEAVIQGLKQSEELPPPPQQPALPPPPKAANSSTPPRPVAAPAPRPAAAEPVRPPAPPPRPVVAPRPAAAPAGRQPAPRPATPQPAPRPAAQPPAPRIAAMQPKAATAVAASPAVRAAAAAAARPLPRGQVAAYPRAVPAPDPEAEVEDNDEPETIEEIIAAAESAAAPDELDDIIEAEAEADDEAGAAKPVHEPPKPRAEPRSAAHRPAAAAPAPAPAPPRTEGRPLPAIVARAEAARNGRPVPRTAETARRAGTGSDAAERRHDGAPAGRMPAAARPTEPPARPRNGLAAMSSVREVEVEAAGEGDPQQAIERAIATLEREARNDGEASPEAPGARTGGNRRSGTPDRAAPEAQASPDPAFAGTAPEAERGGGSAVTIFLLVFLVLLVGAGGAGYWAWHEGFIDLDAMFGRTQPVATAPAANKPVADKPGAVGPRVAAAPTPGRTAATAATAATNTEPASNTPAQSAEQMSAAPAAGAVAPAPATAEPSAQTGSGPKSEERLTESAGTPALPATTDVAKANTDAGVAAPAGSQSLLLEASPDGTTGAVPFSGTVEWSKGTDEMGQPTLIGKANIPARNLGVNVLIRKNADPTLPASHLMEINFTVSDSFIGGAISGLPGVLLKNEELMQGTPLVGASARVVGNSFLFALSSSPADETTNKDLLTSRKWIDLAIIYATGKKAIITLEKDDKAEALFNDVFNAWSGKSATTPAAPAAAPASGG